MRMEDGYGHKPRNVDSQKPGRQEQNVPQSYQREHGHPAILQFGPVIQVLNFWVPEW
jgi:hypothetical protein